MVNGIEQSLHRVTNLVALELGGRELDSVGGPHSETRALLDPGTAVVQQHNASDDCQDQQHTDRCERSEPWCHRPHLAWYHTERIRLERPSQTMQ